jgi:hypothetical protein
MALSINARKEKLVNNPESSDVTFIVGVEAVKMYGNRFLLKSTNDVFAAMFTNEFSEQRTAEVIIPDIEPGVFLELLRYIYCEKANITKDNLEPLFAAANKYLMKDLEQLCLQSIDESNAVFVYKANEGRLKFDNIKEKCKSVITNCPFKALDEPDTKSLSENELTDILRACNHRISVRDVNTFIDKWHTGKKPAMKAEKIVAIESDVFCNTLVYEHVCMDKATLIKYVQDTTKGTKKATCVHCKVTKITPLIGFGVLWNAGISSVQISSYDLSNKKYKLIIEKDTRNLASSTKYIERVFFDKVAMEPGVEYLIQLNFEVPKCTYIIHEKGSTTETSLFTFNANPNGYCSSFIAYFILINE